MRSHAPSLAALAAVALCALAPRAALPQAGGAAARAAAAPCDAGPHRRLDFWLGEWEVQAGGQAVATNRLSAVLGGCALLEEYAQPDGYGGRSISFYDAALGRWRQTWVDRAGNVSEFTGEFRDGAMRFEGETHTPDGRRVLRRMTVTPLAAGRVRQHSERSDDQGRTWAVAYDFTYVKKRVVSSQ